MSDHVKRPSFFICSTIYDFADLRSSLKFYLEEWGCRVLASEYNDFEKPVDQHSYEACLKAIQSADYFVLLVGSRVGGWYDKNKGISITQREYQEAYAQHRAGKLKLLNFVRSSVWQVREDRKELGRYLAAQDPSGGLQKAVANYPSKFAENAEFLSNFIGEISRNKETALAVEGKGPAPSGNWVHVFSEFRDIVNVLQTELFAGRQIEDMMLRRLLRRELQQILADCLLKLKSDAAPLSPRRFIDRLHAEQPVDLDALNNKTFAVADQLRGPLAMLGVRLGSRQVHAVVLSQAIAQPNFLQFDVSSGVFKETPQYEALLRLSDEIRRLNFATSANSFLRTAKMLADGKEPPTIELIALLGGLDRLANVVDLSAALIRHLDGAAYVHPNLRPDSPIKGMQEQLDAEAISIADVERFVSGKK